MLNEEFIPVGRSRTGTVSVAFPNANNPQDTHLIVEVAPTSTGSFTQVAVLQRPKQNGQYFLHSLALDGVQRFYRFKSTRIGYADSTYSAVISGRPTIIPEVDLDAIDFSSIGILPLTLVMTVFSQDSASMHVTASVNTDPIGAATPTIELLTYSGLQAAPVATGSGGWLLAKPSGSVSGRATFRNFANGRIDGIDAIDIAPQATTLTDNQFLALTMHVVSSSATSMSLSASVDNPTGAPLHISLLGSSAPVSASNPSFGIFHVTRPAVRDAICDFEVTTSVAGILADRDHVHVTKDNLTPLSIVVEHGFGTITSESMVIIGIVKDPYQTTTTLTGHTITVTASDSVLGNGPSGLRVDSAGIVSDVGATYHHYTVTRPLYNAGNQTVTLTVTKPGYAPDSDSIVVPERSSGLGNLVMKANLIGSDYQSVTVSASAENHLTGIMPSMSFTMSPTGVNGFSGSNPYWISKARGQIVNAVFTATLPGFTQDTAIIEIPMAEMTAPHATVFTSQSATQGYMELEVADPDNRLDGVFFRVASGSGDWSEYVEDSSVIYSAMVDLVEKQPSHIAYRLTHFNISGSSQVTEENQVTFNASPKPSIPLITARIQEDGDIILTFTGDADAKSHRYAWSTSAMPDDGTVDSSGTNIDGRVAVTGVVTTLGVGDRLFVKARSFSEISAGGVGSDYGQYAFDRQNSTNTKTIIVPYSSFVSALSGQTPLNYDSGFVNASVFSDTQEIVSSLVLPNGVEVVEIRARVYTDNSSAAQVIFLRSDGSGASSILDSDSVGDVGNWTTITLNTAEEIDYSQYVYSIYVNLTCGAINHLDVRLSHVEIEYTVPSYIHTI